MVPQTLRYLRWNGPTIVLGAGIVTLGCYIATQHTLSKFGNSNSSTIVNPPETNPINPPPPPKEPDPKTTEPSPNTQNLGPELLPDNPPLYFHSPTQKHTHTIILLHGTSTTGPIFANELLNFPIQTPLQSQNSVTSETKTLPEIFPTTKWVFPTGKQRTSTVFGGKLLHAWFDITTFEDRTVGEDRQVEGLKDGVEYLSDVIREEVIEVGGKNENVVFGGFSQGCAMSVFTMLSGRVGRGFRQGKLGGFVGLSGWLPFRRQIGEVVFLDPGDGKGEKDVEESRKKTVAYVEELLGLEMLGHADLGGEVLDTRMFFAHGMDDGKVLPRWALEMVDTLSQMGVERNLNKYEGLGHSLGGEEMVDLVGFLKDCGVHAV